MSRVARMLLAVMLGIAVAGELPAQSPEPSPLRAARVAVPEQGYAVGVPVGAFGIDLSADVERQVLASLADDPAAANRLLDDDPRAIALLIVALEDWRDSGWQVVVMGDEAMCQYSAIRETPPDFDTFALDLYTDLLNDEKYTQVEPRRSWSWTRAQQSSWRAGRRMASLLTRVPMLESGRAQPSGSSAEVRSSATTVGAPLPMPEASAE